MAEVPLTQGKVALVDDEDYERVSQFKWHAKRVPDSDRFYAARNVPNPLGRRGYQRLHSFILDAAPGQEIDHQDGEGLNNTRANLRFATTAQNQANQRPSRSNTTGFKGVSWHRGRYRARVKVNGNIISLGVYDTGEEAARAYDQAAIEHHGEFAHPNFPSEVS
jgi:hypothetical protein